MQEEQEQLLRHFNTMDAEGRAYVMHMAKHIAEQCRAAKSPNLTLVVGGRECGGSAHGFHNGFPSAFAEFSVKAQ